MYFSGITTADIGYKININTTTGLPGGKILCREVRGDWNRGVGTEDSQVGEKGLLLPTNRFFGLVAKSIFDTRFKLNLEREKGIMKFKISSDLNCMI